MPLTEARALRALPPRGFVHDYACYALQQTTAPLAYHVGVGLSVLAPTCPVDYGVRYAATDLRSNLFVLLAGRSGDEQKSTALGLGQEVLDAAAPGALADYPGSPEGLIDTLAENPRALLLYSEFGKFLAAAQDGHMMPMKSTLADLFDARPTQRARSKKGGVRDVIRVQKPRLSVLAASSHSYLFDYTTPEDWAGGFMGRWAVLDARRERVDPFPSGNVDGREALIATLHERWERPGGWCMGLDPESKAIWTQWFYELESRRVPDLIAGVRVRTPTFAMKAALLYGWDYGPALNGASWFITPDVLLPAIEFAEMHFESVLSLAEQMTSHPDARLRARILGAFNPGEILSIGDVIRRTLVRKRTVMEMLDSLAEEEALSRISEPGGGTVYARLA